MTEPCLTRATSTRPRPEAPLPFISVIVPVRNEAAFIRGTLYQLLEQDYDPERFEILVADGRSSDATADIVRELMQTHPNVYLLDNPGVWSSAGRNCAVRAARGDLVLLVDGHCELGGPGYLLDLATAFARSGADCIGRPQPLDVAGATPLQRAIAAARASRLGHNPASHIYSSDEGFVPPQSVAIAYRRSVFDTVGHFDETFDACEDVEFNHRVARAGLRCYFTPRARVSYHPRTTLLGLFRQMARYGRGRVRLLRKHPDTFSVPCLLPAFFVLGLCGGAALASFSASLARTYAAGLGLYAAIVAAASVLLTLKMRDWRLLPWLPPVFAAIHCGAGTGLLRELLRGRRGMIAVQAVETPRQLTPADPAPTRPDAPVTDGRTGRPDDGKSLPLPPARAA
jgi:succinoglycan biosynthesis protein ExoA